MMTPGGSRTPDCGRACGPPLSPLLRCWPTPTAAAQSPTHHQRPECGHLYWTNGYWIGRASLNGTGVNQRFITKVAYGTGIVAIRSGYLYWANLGALGGAEKGRGTIGRARLNGTDVNQKFITGASLPTGVTVAGGFIYWANDDSGTIGRARLNGTDVDQRFIITKPSKSLLGLFGLAVDTGH
jgi:virginiamycin B lyase